MTERNDKGRFTTPDDKQISKDHEELLGLYLTSLREQKPGTSDRTIETRSREVRYWLAFCEEYNIGPLAAETSDVRSYIQGITHNADTTIDSYYRSVQSFYTIIQNDQRHEELELVNGHPCKDKSDIDLKNDYRVHPNTSEYRRIHSISATNVDGIRSNSDDILALKPDTVHKLFNNPGGRTRETKLRNEIACRLNWYTGCRSVELERLSIENIDWDNCSINVRSAKLNPSENPDLARRDVYFPKKFRLQLRRWCSRERHAFSAAAEPNEGKILVTTHSDHMDSSQINRAIKEAAKNAGVQQPLRPADPAPNEEVKEWFVTTHRIRRSAISHWVNDCEELSLHQARRVAGHARIEQTMEYVEDDDEQIAEDYQQAMQD